MLSSKIEKRHSSIEGSGLFAKEPIAKGEKVWSPTESLVEKIHIDELDRLSEIKRKEWIKHSYQIGEFLYKDIDDTQFMNHSCNPNVIDSYYSLIASRDIPKDEEITWSYLQYMNPYLVFKCSCGSKNCVGTVQKGASITKII